MAMNFPAAPTIGQVYQAEGMTFVWTGSVWIIAGNTGAGIIVASATPPAGALPGQLWYQTVDPVGLMLLYSDGDSTQWIMIAASGGPQRANNAEALAGIDTAKMMTPAATAAARPYATAAEVLAGTVTDNVVSPAVLASGLNSRMQASQATNSGTAADITPSFALLGSTPNFRSKSDIVFIHADLVANSTAAANTIFIEARLYDIASGVLQGAASTQAGRAAAIATSAAYSLSAGSLAAVLLGLDRILRIDLYAKKQVAEGPIPVTMWRVTGFCI